LSTDSQLQQNETMPKIDIIKDAAKLTNTNIVYMKRVEEQNLQRAKQVQKYRKANSYTALVCGLAVIGIYAYTIHSVKQEKFLDDFEVPEKIIDNAT
ncbi:Coiled-coil domain-containing protein 56, partial [Cyphomyrmex costatus]